METQKFFHSVTLDRDKCKGCINCIKRCPTEAIRVRNGKAKIIKERCIDCGECIRVCPHHAKKAIYDPLEVLTHFKYKIALPAPALYGQFNNLEDVDIVLNALIEMGFDEVYEVAKAAELVSDATRKILRENKLPKPIISSACPAVTRLIRVRFPTLIDNILPLNAPVELAARLAKEEAVKKTGLPPEEIRRYFHFSLSRQSHRRQDVFRDRKKRDLRSIGHQRGLSSAGEADEKRAGAKILRPSRKDRRFLGDQYGRSVRSFDRQLSGSRWN